MFSFRERKSKRNKSNSRWSCRNSWNCGTAGKCKLRLKVESRRDNGQTTPPYPSKCHQNESAYWLELSFLLCPLSPWITRPFGSKMEESATPSFGVVIKHHLPECGRILWAWHSRHDSGESWRTSRTRTNRRRSTRHRWRFRNGSASAGACWDWRSSRRWSRIHWPPGASVEPPFGSSGSTGPCPFLSCRTADCHLSGRPRLDSGVPGPKLFRPPLNKRMNGPDKEANT